MLAFANAKINLGLHVVSKRNDGYHNLETVFYPIGIHDVVEISDSDHTQFEQFGVNIPGSQHDNLCMRAFKALDADFNLPPQRIILLKNIPVGAGLGGGSADAAFLVKLLNDKFRLGLSNEQMEDYVRPLGADCAFFIKNKPVFAHGKGDEFTPLELDLSKYYFVLVKPEVHVSTADAYRGIIPAVPSTSLKDLIHLPLKDWKRNIVNDFEATVFSKYPQIREVKDQLYAKGAIYAAMSGSGSSVFGIFEIATSLKELEQDHKVFYNV
jgi:4-diphosphocytidyl-2-C-methyl-D-erythritol kinase